MNEKVRIEYHICLRLVLNAVLNTQNGISAINALDVALLQFSFKILNWNIQRMNVKTTKLLTFHCIYHPQMVLIVCICPDPTEADD